MKKIVIIGGMAAGCKTAARLKRIKPDFDVTIIEKKSFISYGSCGMPFYASGDIDGFMELATTPWGMVRDETFFKDVKDINVLTNVEAVKIDKEKKEVFCRNIQSNEEKLINYDYLVIATGAKAVKANFVHPETENISNFHNPLDAKRFKSKAQTGKIGSVAIIGAGFIGCELAEAMVSLWGIETHLIEIADRLMPRSLDSEMSKILEKILSENDISLHLNSTVEKIELNVSDECIVHLNDTKSITVDHVFTCMGVKPDISLAQDIGINIGELGGIEVDSELRTNMPDTWAAGDCVEVKDIISGRPSFFPLGSLSNREGRVVADSIAGLKSIFKGAIGTASIKVFETIFASSGLTESAAKDCGYKFGTVWGTWFDRPDYMPESQALFAKLVYERESLRLLGFQIAGKGEVTRYIDAFSIFATNHATAYDLIDFEHAYTPTHSGPLNPLNYLGGMIIAQEKNDVKCINPLSGDTFIGNIIDVREDNEIEAYKYSENAVETSISNYRSYINELNKDEPLLFVCLKGPRSYEAARTFINNGYKNVSYLGGGVQLARVIF